MKIVTRKDKGFTYEHESTAKRNFYNALESAVNHALLFTFSGSVLTAVVLVIVNLAQ